MEDFQQGADHSSRPIRSAALRGYVPDKCLAALIKAASVQDLRRSLVAIGGDHLMILLAGTLSYLLWRDVAWWAAALAAPVTLTIAGRAMRGLECLVHEASHYNLTRRRRLNDAIANVLCAWSVLSEVQQYRTSHMIHHRSFGHADDPDRVRNLRLMLEDFDRSSLAALTVGAVRRIVPYVPGWWWAIGLDGGTGAKFVAWHVMALWLPLAVLLGPAQAAVFWGLAWGGPGFFALPVIRFIAEAAEHDYLPDDADATIFTRTWSNIGAIHRIVFHPHNDGYHAVHHLYPSVPHHKLHRVHRLLAERDQAFATDALIRTKVTSSA